MSAVGSIWSANDMKMMVHWTHGVIDIFKTARHVEAVGHLGFLDELYGGNFFYFDMFFYFNVWTLVTIHFNRLGHDCNAFFLWNSSSVFVD